MQKRIMLMSAVVVTLLSSCVKDSISEPDFNTDLNGVTFTASMELATKTTLDTETGEVAWAVGDVVKFDYEIGKEDCEPVVSQPLTSEDIVDGIARFTADVPEEFLMTEKEYKESLEEGAKNSRHMYVVYPSVETEYEASTYYVTIPVEQDGSFESASIALAKWNPYTPTAELNFMNLCALLQFTVPEGMTDVRQIVFTAANRKIAGKADVGFGSVVPYTPYVKGMTDESSTTVTVNVDGPGTYYAAVSTGELKDICLAYRDEDGNPVGELVSGVSFNAERAMIYRVGATIEADNFPGEGGYFVKSEACGAKDGSSWDNAADYTALHALLDNDLNGKTADDARTMTVYMAAGTHSVSKQLNVTPAHNVKIYGGYPAAAKGVSLSGRDVVANATIIDGGESCKIWNLTAGVWEISGLQFQNAKATDGSAITIKNNIVITCSDCTFKNNVATKTGAGAVYFYGLGAEADVLFENCSFIGNKATKTDGSANTGLGGAVGSASTFKGGVVTFKNCLFKDNEAARNGGAMWVRTVHTRILDCNFIDNKAGTVTETGFGTQLHVDGSYALSVYCDGCYFSLNTLDLNSLVHTNNTSAESCLALNNCVVAGAWGAGGKVSVYNGGKGKLVLSNSTAFGQMGGIVKNTSTGSVSVLNCIVPHTTSTGMGYSFLNNGEGTFTVKKTLYSAVKSDQTFETEGNLDGIFVNSESEESNFPVNEKYVWYKGSSGGQRANNNTSKTAVDDVRGNVYYYAWDGVYPEGAEFTNATLDEVTNLVKAADANFAEWLGDRLGKDIRGVQRDAASMWPGSYQN